MSQRYQFLFGKKIFRKKLIKISYFCSIKFLRYANGIDFIGYALLLLGEGT
jgi:hypothetical protein